jgi:pseudouridine-5'-monophosphatase
VPHPDVALEYQARHKDVLAGRMRVNEVGDDFPLGGTDDGWAEYIPSLENFDYRKYGMDVSF